MELLRGIKGILLDVDGTLVDSNDAHARAWIDAFREYGYTPAYHEVRSLIGMGGDRLVPRLTDLNPESREAKDLDKLRGQIFRENYLPDLKAFTGARLMIERILERKLVPVIATSASSEDMEAILKQTNLEGLVERKTNSDDADNSKPEPDILLAALERGDLKPGEALMIGDTPYDISAAKKAGLASVGFTCGGWPANELSGTLAVFEGPWEFVEKVF